jgi:hypothetical protein
MMSGNDLCPHCQTPRKPLPESAERNEGRCLVCGRTAEDEALSEFADRLARFGLGATRESLFTREPELPDGK